MLDRYTEEVTREWSEALSDVPQGGWLSAAAWCERGTAACLMFPDQQELQHGTAKLNTESAIQEEKEQVCVINEWSGSSNFDGS